MSTLTQRRRLNYLRSLQQRVTDEIAALEYQMGGPRRHVLPTRYQTITEFERETFLAAVAAVERCRQARSDGPTLRWARARATEAAS